MNLDDDDFEYVDELPARPHRTIPQADRELLELAARALGAVHVEDVDGEEWLILHFAEESIRHGWNPLIHSDDALELAVRLELSIDPRKDAVCVIAGEGKHVVIEMGIGAQSVPAARRAITRTAAAVGKAKE